MRGAFHHAEIFALLAVQFRFERKIGHADDPVHRSADLVAHVREELALRAISGIGGFLGLAQLSLRLFALGNILEHDHGAVNLLGTAANRRNDKLDRKRRIVSAPECFLGSVANLTVLQSRVNGTLLDRIYTAVSARVVHGRVRRSPD